MTESAGILSAPQVALAYQLLLGRTAAPADITRITGAGHTAQSLRLALLQAPEFALKFDAIRAAQQSQDPPALVHLHIPKTAGSSLTRILCDNTQPETQFALDSHDPAGMAEFGALTGVARRKLRLVFGHLMHGIGRALPQGCLYICLLRRPGPRLFSYYRYIRRTVDHPLYPVVTAGAMDFGAFLDSCATDPLQRTEANNGQMRRLAGRMGGNSVGDEAAIFRTALAHVMAPDMIFGLTEHFDLLLADLTARGLIADSAAVFENAAPEGADFDQACAALTAAQRILLEVFTRWDARLYDICQAAVLGLPPYSDPASIDDEQEPWT